MRLLDLFSGAGGAAMGYSRAGFTEIVGVDIKPQPRYPFTFVQADALEYASMFWPRFDAIHASPPCQAHVQWQNLNEKRYGSRVEHEDFIDRTRQLCQAIGLPWVIENVTGAPLRAPLMLCGSRFGLDVRRHRMFESFSILYGRIWFSWNSRQSACDCNRSKNCPPGFIRLGCDWRR